MLTFIRKLVRNLVGIFSWKNLKWHVLAFALTLALVASGFDWYYFHLFQGTLLYKIMFSAALVGGALPILLPLVSLIIVYFNKNKALLNATLALVQAAFLGWFISSVYKIFTGRVGPPLHAITDTSQVFRFGFFRGGIFWGWPSSHTTVAFAMAFTIFTMFPKNKIARASALLYAFYIGIGVSMTIHWFSDFIAGAIIGTVIGITVGKNYVKN